jgi:hypothetical protein
VDPLLNVEHHGAVRRGREGTRILLR